MTSNDDLTSDDTLDILSELNKQKTSKLTDDVVINKLKAKQNQLKGFEKHKQSLTDDFVIKEKLRKHWLKIKSK